MPQAPASHTFRFFRSGGFDQVRLDRGEDLLAIERLDQKLWVALACPTRGLEIDPKTMDLVDLDHDGKIRAPELIAALRWATSALTRPAALIEGAKQGGSLPLADIDGASPVGAALLAAAKRILHNLGKDGATAITLADVSNTNAIFANQLNGDGVIPLGLIPDPAARVLADDIVATIGPASDKSGVPGVDLPRVDAFFAEAAALLAWHQKADDDATIRPLGDATAAAAAAFDAVAAKVDDFFTRCRLAAFDQRAAAPLNRSDTEWVLLAGEDLTADHARIAAFPIARVEAGRGLPLGPLGKDKAGPSAAGLALNPAWSARIARLAHDTVTPLLGARTELAEAEWQTLRARLAPYHAWTAAKSGVALEALGRARVAAYVSGGERAIVTDLIARDAALKPEMDAIASVEQLIRYHRDLHTLTENFVNMKRFYAKEEPAIFQAGTLYLDNRSMELCVFVDDLAKHSAQAPLSAAYLAYCECARRGSNEKVTIAVAFTNGDLDFLRLGRNGVFYDRKGRDWDATITKIVESPISIRQAFWSPYKRVGRMIEEQIERFASSREKAVHETSAAHVTTAATAAFEQPPAPGAPAPASGAPAASRPAFDIAKVAGVFAAIGLALGAIGSVLLAIVSGFVSLEVWQMPLALAGVVLLISGPSMLLAAMKLRKRNLGPLLEANGWAVNARAKINIPFGASLTQLPVLPKGAERAKVDPYKQKKSPWPFVIGLVVVLAITFYVLWDKGFTHTWFGFGPPRAAATIVTPDAPKDPPKDAPKDAPKSP